jgi:hypothetical protein
VDGSNPSTRVSESLYHNYSVELKKHEFPKSYLCDVYLSYEINVPNCNTLRCIGIDWRFGHETR